MIEIWPRPALPDRWRVPPSDDIRLISLLRLANLICDAYDYASVGCTDAPVLAPLELAALLRTEAERLESFTDDSTGD